MHVHVALWLALRERYEKEESTSSRFYMRSHILYPRMLIRPKSSRPTWPRGQNHRPQPLSIRPWPRPRPHAFSRRLSSWHSCQSSKSRHLRCSFLIGNSCLLYNILLKLTFEYCIDTVVTAIVGCDFLVSINFMLERKRSYCIFYNLCDISGLSFGLGLIVSGLGLGLTFLRLR